MIWHRYIAIFILTITAHSAFGRDIRYSCPKGVTGVVIEQGHSRPYPIKNMPDGADGPDTKVDAKGVDVYHFSPEESVRGVTVYCFYQKNQKNPYSIFADDFVKLDKIVSMKNSSIFPLKLVHGVSICVFSGRRKALSCRAE